MARRRMIDPSIWSNEQAQCLSTSAFKVYVFLISQSDDEGYLKVSLVMWPSLINPVDRSYTKEQLVNDLNEILVAGLVEAYRSGDEVYVKHPHWTLYQTIQKPSTSKYPKDGERIYRIEEYRNDIGTVSHAYHTDTVPIREEYDTDTIPVNDHSHFVPPKLSKEKLSKDNTKIPSVASAEPQPEPGEATKPAEEPEPESSPLPPPDSEPKPEPDIEPVLELECQAPKKRKVKRQTGSNEPTDPLYHSIKGAFLSVAGDFTNWGKEGKAIHGIIEKCSRASPEDPAGCAERMIGELWRLKNSADRFYRDQPFVPSTLNASGIWDRVAEQLKVTADELEGVRMWEALDPYGVRGKSKQAVGG